jgi:hypothetical protein
MSAVSPDLPVLTDEAARVAAVFIVSQNIVAVAGVEALAPPQLHRVLPAVAQLPRRVAPASTAPPVLQQPPPGTALHAFWPAPTNLWMLGTVMYMFSSFVMLMYITHCEDVTFICVTVVLIVCHVDVHHTL